MRTDERSAGSDEAYHQLARLALARAEVTRAARALMDATKKDIHATAAAWDELGAVLLCEAAESEAFQTAALGVVTRVTVPNTGGQ